MSASTHLAELRARTHELKVWPPFYVDVESGKKSFELRLNDREFAEGDTLRLREFVPTTGIYTGRECLKRVTYVLSAGEMFGLKPGFAVLALQSQEPDHGQ